MRLIDELDIGPARAPLDVFTAFAGDMDWVSKWHWYKHVITAPWHNGVNVNSSTRNDRKEIEFSVVVYPARSESIGYWLPQVARPIEKALGDEECFDIIRSEFGISVYVKRDQVSSRASPLGKQRQEFEDDVLTSRRPVVLVIDDESKKLMISSTLFKKIFIFIGYLG